MSSLLTPLAVPGKRTRPVVSGILCLEAVLRAGEGEVARNIISSAASLLSSTSLGCLGEVGGGDSVLFDARGGPTSCPLASLDVLERAFSEVSEGLEDLEDMDIMSEVNVAAAFMSSFTVGASALRGGGPFLDDVFTRGDAFGEGLCGGNIIPPGDEIDEDESGFRLWPDLGDLICCSCCLGLLADGCESKELYKVGLVFGAPFMLPRSLPSGT